MARKSRKQNPLVPIPEKQTVHKKYSVGAYVRLSVLDNGKNSDSIETQKSIIIDYIDNNSELELYQIYSDNGATGTNFKRDGFNALLEDVKSKKVDCVIVKDLSRFGRNYIETGNFLEKIFPFLGVRFISIADHFDTFDAEKSEDGYIIPLKNLIHDIYAKDVSRKVGLTKNVMQKKGEYVGGTTLYGYVRSETDRRKLVIDKETAPIVRRIFEMRASGMSYLAITQILKDEGILSPSMYRYQKRIVKNEKFANAPWRVEVVKRMLLNPIYTGNMVQGRTKQSIYNGQRATRMNEDEFITVPHTHEAIISEELFDKVMQMRKNNLAVYRERTDKYAEMVRPDNVLKGVIYCGDCGSRLLSTRSITNRGERQHIYHYYYCPNSQYKDGCARKSIRQEVLTQAVLTTIAIHIKQLGKLKQTISSLRNNRDFQKSKQLRDREIRGIQAQITEKSQYKKALLETYFEKKISETDYLSFTKSYDEEMALLQNRLTELSENIVDVDTVLNEAKWIMEFEKFSPDEELTPETIKALVGKVVVNAPNEIDITLKYTDEYKMLLSQTEQYEVKAYG